MPKNVRVNGLDEVIVRACVDHFQSGGFRFVRTEHDYERVNFASDQPGKQLGAFANPSVTEREAQEQDVKCRPLEEAVCRRHIFAFEDFELRAQSGRNL
jgi:hypothetical protein